jgi:hypothetical protein
MVIHFKNDELSSTADSKLILHPNLSIVELEARLV